MPIPTDKLADDIETIRSDVATLRRDTTAGFEKVRDDMASMRVELKGEIGELKAEFREFRGEAKAIFGILKWGVPLIVVGVLGQAANAIWYTAKLDGRVNAQEDRLSSLEKSTAPTVKRGPAGSNHQADPPLTPNPPQSE